MKKRNQMLSLKELCFRLGLVIAQRYSRRDVKKRCKLLGLPFGLVESTLLSNDMLTDLDSEVKIPF